MSCLVKLFFFGFVKTHVKAFKKFKTTNLGSSFGIQVDTGVTTRLLTSFLFSGCINSTPFTTLTSSV